MHDLIIIGAGWAGLNAALKARSSGLDVVLIEKSLIGGTCLNRGCIPTKALLQSAKIYSWAKKASVFGVSCSESSVDWAKAQARKEKLILGLRKGLESRLNGINLVSSAACFKAAGVINAADKEFRAKHILIACGSQPQMLKGLNFDGNKVLSSDDILDIAQIPASLLVVGGGAIGCEFATLFASLGTQVTVVELLPQLLPGIDNDIAKKLEVSFIKKGIKVITGCDVDTLDKSGFEKILVSIGRKPMLDGLHIEQAGVSIEKGAVKVNAYGQTNVSNVYAAGDCTAKLMLAHFATYQARLTLDHMTGRQPQPIDIRYIPACVFTEPEVAFIGIGQQQAEQDNIGIDVYRSDFLGSGMARIMEEAEGFVKVIADNKTGKIIGAGIIGPKATELISTLAVAINAGVSVSDIKHMVLPHPSLSEVISEMFHK